MKIKKLITPELVDELLNKTEFNEQDSHNEAHVEKVVLNYYESEIVNDWSQAVDFHIYEETTADGYSVYVATYDDQSVSVNENVHYYDTNLGKELSQAITEGCKIYLADMDDYYVTDVMRELYTNLCEKRQEEIVIELIDEGYEEIK